MTDEMQFPRNAVLGIQFKKEPFGLVLFRWKDYFCFDGADPSDPVKDV